MGEELRCDYCGKTGFKTPQALAGHIGFKHPEEVGDREAGGIVTPKTETREVPIVEDDFTTAELVRSKRMDIMRNASYGACDKLALRQLKATATFLPPGIISFAVQLKIPSVYLIISQKPLTFSATYATLLT